MSDKLESETPSDAVASSRLSSTPETDRIYNEEWKDGTSETLASLMIDHAERMEIERDKARADSLRLEWLDRNWNDFEGICCRSTTSNLREMIDAEMAAENSSAQPRPSVGCGESSTTKNP